MSDFSDGQIKQWREFHPRAVKLLSRHKPFVVVACDEPYYMQVYSLIREHEMKIGRWSDEDERIYQDAQHSVQADLMVSWAKMQSPGESIFPFRWLVLPPTR